MVASPDPHGRVPLAGRPPRRVLWQGKPAVLSTLVDVTESYQRELASGTFSSVGLDEGDIRCAVRDRYRLGKIVGKSPAIRAVYERVLKAVPKEASVLITGESGTGKEVVARTIHMLSPRSKGPFVPVNCGAIPSELLESEFFGYRKGAFTGAYANKQGLLDKANRGTLFLDEVAELPLNMQVKLLRFLDDKVFVPIGSTEERSSDIRIVAATNRDLRSCIDNGTMREDFFFRLFIIPIHLPPLRERKEDIPLLIEEFLYRASGGKDTPFIPGYVTDAFLRYDWPGNVRELQNTLQRYLAIGHAGHPHQRRAQGNGSARRGGREPARTPACLRTAPVRAGASPFGRQPGRGRQGAWPAAAHLLPQTVRTCQKRQLTAVYGTLRNPENLLCFSSRKPGTATNGNPGFPPVRKSTISITSLKTKQILFFTETARSLLFLRYLRPRNRAAAENLRRLSGRTGGQACCVPLIKRNVLDAGRVSRPAASTYSGWKPSAPKARPVRRPVPPASTSVPMPICSSRARRRKPLRNCSPATRFRG